MKIYLIELTFLIPEDKGKCKILFSTQKLFIKSSSTIINNYEIFNILFQPSVWTNQRAVFTEHKCTIHLRAVNGS